MRRARTSRLVLTVGVLLALVVAAAGTWRVVQLAQDSRARLTALRGDLAVATPTAAAPTVVTTTRPAEPTSEAAVEPAPGLDGIRQRCAEAGVLERDLAPVGQLAGAAAPAAQLVGRVTQIGERATALLILTQAAGEITSAVRLACDALEPTFQAQATASDATSLMEKMVQTLGGSRDQVRLATARLRAAQAQLAAIDDTQLDDSTRRFLVDVRDRLPAATNRLALLAEIPGMLGFDGPRTYLVLGQNSDELRPTGGFIGTSGLLTFDRGRLVEQEYGSSFGTLVPPDLLVPPPQPLREFMSAGYWHLREANWWPDFPSTAWQARYFHEISRDNAIAGVFAIDQDLIAMLLEVTGPIEVGDYGEVVTAENLRDRLEFRVHVVGAGTEDERKGFIRAVFSTLLGRVQTLPRDRVRDLTAALDQGLTEQHLQIWSEDDRTQQALADLSWDGRMLATSGDYLFPVSANLGMNKVNQKVDQELEYQVTREPSGRLVGRAVLHLRNRWPPDEPGPYATDDYKNYLRVYVPPHSELVSANGFDSEPSTLAECGRTAFAGLVVVKPGHERRVELVYRLSASIQADRYSLLVQKQPGVPAFPLTVSGLGGQIKTEMSVHQGFGLEDGRLAAARRLPVSASTTGRGCEVYADPPLMLRPPAKLTIPKIGVHADFVDLGVEPDGTLEAPSTGEVVGWYAQSGRPGQVGNMIASGHFDWNRRQAVFWRLADLRPGDRVGVVAQGGAWYEYEVRWIRNVVANDAPLNEILGPTSERWLTLITCGGRFDQRTRQYVERTIVRATLIDPS